MEKLLYGNGLVLEDDFEGDGSTEWSYQLTMYPKSRVDQTDEGNVIPPVVTPETPEPGDKDVHNETNVGSNKTPETAEGNSFDSLLQTSGEIMKLPLVQIALSMFGLFILFAGLIILWKRKRDESEQQV